jgi:hypothetical protein
MQIQDVILFWLGVTAFVALFLVVLCACSIPPHIAT